MIRIGFSGARPPDEGVSEEISLVWPRLLLVVAEIIEDLSADAVVVHGDARGVDREARRLAELRGLRTEARLPDWQQYGPRAALIRNVYVTTCAVVHAFPAPWSRGTYDAIEKAKRVGVVLVDHSKRYWP